MRDIKYKTKIVTKDDLAKLEELHLQKQASPYKNLVLLSAFSGLTNDPVGLNYFNGQYNIFLQNAPFTGWHANKSWGYFSSKDLLNFEYHGQAIVPSIPQDINGAFSGSAFVKNNKLNYYYTGNVRTETGRDAYTIKAEIDLVEKKTKKEVLFKHPVQSGGEYRDPYLFEVNNKLFLVCGSRDEKLNGTLYVHVFDESNQRWKFYSELKINLPEDLKGYMIECPNLVKIEENKWLLVFSNEQDKEKIPFFHHKTLWVTGELNDDLTEFKPSSNFELLNYGPDFYAPQIFSGPKGLQMLGWLGTSQNEQLVTEPENWAYDLSLMRSIHIKDGKVFQKPVVEQLLDKNLQIENNNIKIQNVAVYLTGNVKNKFLLKIVNQENKNMQIEYKDGRLDVTRQDMSFTDEINFPNFVTNNFKIENFEIIIDKSVVEIFFNKGKHVLSVKYFVNDWNKIIIDGENLKASSLKSLNTYWNNTVFEQS